MSAAPSRLGEALRTGFWAVPAGCVVLALLLAFGLVEVDRALGDDLGRFTFGAGPDGAREVLSAITTSMITFTGLVFSITIVVLQLTSSQFSPRVLRTFLRDRQTQLSLGVFVATFVYAVMVLRTVNSREDAQFVPAVATTAGVVLLLASVGVFVAYIHHVATAIQVSSIVRAVGDETRQVLDRQVPRDANASGPRPALGGRAIQRIPSPAYGVVRTVDHRALVHAASEADVLLVLLHRFGGFVPEDAPLLDVHGTGQVDERAVAAAVRLGKDRTLEQDVACGLRQLVDIAERALSPGVNDPTTAVQALDEIHDLLRRLVARHLPDGVHRDQDGTVRLLTPPLLLVDLLALALDEIEQYGSDSQQVQARVDTLLTDLLDAALPEHQPALLARQQRRAGRSAPTPSTSTSAKR